MDETILVNYLQGECNDEEAARVEAWCEEGPENRKTLEQLYYTLFVGERIAVMNTVDTEASLDQFKSAIREKEKKAKRKSISIRWGRYDKHAPFIVNSKQIKTCVLGTKFNVRARQDENRVVTTLLQGLVRVDSPRTEENGYLLKPGQTLNVNTDTYQAELIEYNQPTDVLLWINGKLEFKQQSLLEITNIMEKLYDIKFIYKDEALKSERFTGEFSTDSTADEILNVLMHTNHFSYKKDGRIVRVMKK